MSESVDETLPKTKANVPIDDDTDEKQAENSPIIKKKKFTKEAFKNVRMTKKKRTSLTRRRRGSLREMMKRKLKLEQDQMALKKQQQEEIMKKLYVHRIADSYRPRAEEAPFQTGLVYDERCLLHSADYAHVESPARASTAFELLQEKKLVDRCTRIPARLATEAELKTCHTDAHVQKIRETESYEFGPDEPDSETEGDDNLYNQVIYFGTDTFCNKNTWLASRLSCGGVLALAENVVEGHVQNGFAVVRPPGHHAEEEKAGGFCLFNNVAVAVKCILNKYPNIIKRVLIVDWDVHHGNGTQDLFYDDPNVVYFSVHRYQDGSFYPHTGAASDVGQDTHKQKSDDVNDHGADIKLTSNDSISAVGKTVNVPLPCVGHDNREYLEVWDRVLIPMATEWKPDIIFISAGFDCALGDPLGQMAVSPACFAYLTAKLMDPALGSAGRVVACLEGGYNVRAVSESIVNVVTALLGDPLPKLTLFPEINKIDSQKKDSKHCDSVAADAADDVFASSKRNQVEKSMERYRQFQEMLTQVLAIQNEYWANICGPAAVLEGETDNIPEVGSTDSVCDVVSSLGNMQI